MAVAKRGNPPPARDRRRVLAAIAEFACHLQQLAMQVMGEGS